MADQLKKLWVTLDESGRIKILRTLLIKPICLSCEDLGIEPEILDKYAKELNLIPVFKAIPGQSGRSLQVHAVVGPMFIEGHQRRALRT